MPVDVVHRDRQRGLAVRRDAGVRRRRPAHLQPRPGGGRARDHERARRRSCRCTSSACRPTWTAFLALGRRARRRARRGRGVRDRRDATRARPIGSLGPLAVLLAAPAQGDHHRRGRHDHACRTPRSPRACASCASTRWTSPTSRATARADVVIESYPERGWNYRMTDMQAALGLCQLELLDEILAERRAARRALHRGDRADRRASSRRTSPTTPSAPGSPTRCTLAAGRADRAAPS